MSSTLVAALAGAFLLSAAYLIPAAFPLTWVAFLPLFHLVERARSRRQSALRGWVMGVFTYLFGFYWLVYTISVFGGFPYAVSALIFVIYAMLHALQLALFAWLVRLCGPGPFCLFPALFWAAIEFWFPQLFPWYLANSQLVFKSFIQSADLVGPYGASFVVMWFNAGLYQALHSWKENRPARWHAPVAALAVLVLSSAYGTVRLASVERQIAAGRKLSVAAVQGNIDVDLKWNPALARENLEAYRKLTAQLSDVTVVIWPETALEAWVPEDLTALPADVLPQFAPGIGSFMFGSRSFRGRPGTDDFKAFNTVFLSNADGRILGHYHKQILLAFGEYLPFSKIFSKLPGLPFADGFTPGEGPRALNLPGGIRVAPLICYEDLMPELSRRFVGAADADILVNLTNDAWYGRTVAPWQHARLAQWRAIETRRSLVRVTNTGVTAVIDATGEMVQSLPLFTPAVMKSDVALLTGETLYVRFGDWFAWTLTFAALAVLFDGFRRTRH